MQLARFVGPAGDVGVGLVRGDALLTLPLAEAGLATLADLLETPQPASVVDALAQRPTTLVPLTAAQLLPPIDQQEVWAAGVTYTRSRSARMEESVAAASVYDRVYAADRPELFFKASPHRTVGHGGRVRIRRDAAWNVPEPELALVLNSRLAVVGYTIGNDMSSRDIEGENPLYLPQAKVYDGACALGPWITLPLAMPPRERIGIRLRVVRRGAEAFAGETSIARMARSFEDLVGYLGRDNSFPRGAFLLTGTGIVPDKDFTLEPGDRVEIDIDGIGKLVNDVERLAG